jgi:hypothetical protein
VDHEKLDRYQARELTMSKAAISPVRKPDLTGIDPGSIGQQIAKKMVEDRFHPVLIFGPLSAGKSSLLASLFAFLKLAPDLSIYCSLAEPLVSDATDYGRFARESATWFFTTSVQALINGQRPNVTPMHPPYFIPVVIRLPNGREMRFAFMESSGESYAVDDTFTSVNIFPELRQEIESVLRNYAKGLSILYLAPYIRTGSQLAGASSEIRKAELALVGAFESYHRCRGAGSMGPRDKHLLLTTKWDLHAYQDRAVSDVLRHASQDEVKEFLSRHYAQVLAQLNGQHGRGQFRPHCSGILQDSIVQPHDVLWPVIGRYLLGLWDLLYRHATLQENGKERSLVRFSWR